MNARFIKRQGTIFKSMRVSRRLKGHEAARLLGWNPSKLSRIENGCVQVKSEDVLHIFKTYGVTDDEGRELSGLLAEESEFQWTLLFPELVTFQAADNAVVECLRESRYREAYPLIEALDQLASSDLERGIVQLRRGHRLASIGELEAATVYLNRAETAFERAGEHELRFKAINNSASVALQQGRLRATLRLTSDVIEDLDGRESSTLSEAARRSLAWAQSAHARAGYDSGKLDIEGALGHYDRSIVLFEQAEPKHLGRPLTSFVRIHRAGTLLRHDPLDAVARQELEAQLSTWGPPEDVHDADNYIAAAALLATAFKAGNGRRSRDLANDARGVARRNGLTSALRWIGGLGLAVVMSLSTPVTMLDTSSSNDLYRTKGDARYTAKGNAAVDLGSLGT